MTSKDRVFRIILFLVIIFSFFLRLWKNQELFFWHVDEDIIGLTVKRILVDHRPQLIGFPIPGGIYLGPLVFYLLSVPYGISLMNPQALPYFSAIFSTLTVFLVYLVGKTIFENRTIGLMAAVIYGFSFLTNVYSRIYSGLTLVGILSLLTYFFLFKLIRDKKGGLYFLFLSLVLLIAVQNEGSSFSLLALTILVWLVYRFKVVKRQLKIGLLIFTIFHIPLLIFDIRHNSAILKSFLNFIGRAFVETGGQGANLSFSGTFNIFLNTLSRIFYISGPNNVAEQILPCSDLTVIRDNQSLIIYLIAAFSICLFLATYILSRKRKLGETLIFSHFLIMLFGLLMYNLFMKGYLYDWTLAVFFPGLSLLVASLIYKTYTFGFLQKFIVIVMLFLFTLLNIRLTLTATNNFGLKSKVNAVKLAAAEIGEKNFALDSIGSCFAQGYVYLFWYFGEEQVSSYADEWFGSGIIKPQTDAKANLKVVMVNPSKNESKDFFDKYSLYKAKAFKSIDTGEVEVLFLNPEEM